FWATWPQSLPLKGGVFFLGSVLIHFSLYYQVEKKSSTFLKFFQLIIQQFPSKHIIDIIHDSFSNLLTKSFLFPIYFNVVPSSRHAILSISDHNSVHFN